MLIQSHRFTSVLTVSHGPLALSPSINSPSRCQKQNGSIQNHGGVIKIESMFNTQIIKENKLKYV